jgi:hypothetical protein
VLTDGEASLGDVEERVCSLTVEGTKDGSVEGCCHSLLSEPVGAQKLEFLRVSVGLSDEFKSLFHC